MSTIQTGSLPLFPPSELILEAQIASLRRQMEQVRSEMITTDMRIQGIARLFSSTAAPISQINPLTDPAPLPTFAMSSMSASARPRNSLPFRPRQSPGVETIEKGGSIKFNTTFDISSILTFETSSMLASSSSASGSLSTENRESVIDPDPLSIFDIDSIPTFETSSMSASSSSASGSLFTENHGSVVAPISQINSLIDPAPLPTFETSSMSASSSSTLKLCSVCKKSFEKRNTLKRHMRRKHNNFRPYQCGQCTKGFAEKHGLKRHLLAHTNERPYKCTEAACNRAFKENRRLKEHIKKMHATDPAPLPTFEASSMSAGSSSASGSFIDSSALPTFEASSMSAGSSSASGSFIDSSALPTFEASSMSASSSSAFRSLSALPTFETSSMSTRKKICSVCDKWYANRYTLTRHMKKHLSKPYQCGHCAKGFTEKSLLNKHLRVHKGEKRYKCTEVACNRAFSQRSVLNQHIEAVHMKIKDRLCTFCNASFARNSTLRAHLKNIHLG